MPKLLLAVRPAWCLIGALMVTSPATGQTDDLIFVGSALSDLRSAANPSVGRLNLQNFQLKRDLGAMLNDPPPVPLAALIVPKDAGSANLTVRKVFNDGTTTLLIQHVGAADIDELRKVPKDGLVLFLLHQDFATDPSPEKVAELKRKIGDLPPKEREQARRYAGAVFLDRGVSHPDVAPFIKDFQAAAQEHLEKAVKTAGPLDIGKPYAFGTRPITEQQLAAIPTGKVTDVEIHGTTYKKAWVGSSIVLVKPSHEAVAKPKTGLEMLQLRPDLHQHLSKGNDIPPRPLRSIPGKK